MDTSDRPRLAARAGLVVAALVVALLPGSAIAMAPSATAPSGASPVQVPAQSVEVASVASVASVATVPRPTFWFPFRGSVKVGCVVDNCGDAMKGGHHYWAFDFGGTEGTQVNAAASGIAHIGGRSGCVARTASSNAKRGNWVWIDHGSGRRTQYRHLATITIRDGQRVTPSTQIGTMGHTGISPCAITYTHFEYVVGAKPGSPFGTRVNPGPMLGCLLGVRKSYPQAVNGGNSNWNALNSSPGYRVTITRDRSGC